MSRYIVAATWWDVPHLSDVAKASLLESIPPYQREARSRGRPQLGSGAIYPVPESQIVVDPFTIPDSWPRSYGLDVGLRTAAAWGAKDPSSGVFYVYGEYYREGAEPSLHAMQIKARGPWIPGVIDPAARGRSQTDGRRVSDMYQDLGLILNLAANAVDAGLSELWDAMVSGQFKVFSNCQMWLREFRLYRRDEKGRVVKKNDHLMDATRYWWLSGRDRMRTKASLREPEMARVYASRGMFGAAADTGGGWMT
jgi:hypothetical protein